MNAVVLHRRWSALLTITVIIALLIFSGLPPPTTSSDTLCDTPDRGNGLLRDGLCITPIDIEDVHGIVLAIEWADRIVTNGGTDVRFSWQHWQAVIERLDPEGWCTYSQSYWAGDRLVLLRPTVDHTCLATTSTMQPIALTNHPIRPTRKEL